MRVVLSALILVVGIAVGVGGTLGVQAINDDGDSAVCAIAQEWAREATTGLSAAHDSLTEDEWSREVANLDMLLDIRFKACNP